LQKLAVECVRELPARYVRGANGDKLYISGLEVSEIQE
jgi:hypothetical protein